MLRDIKILSDAQDVPGLLSFLGAYLIHDRDQVGSSISTIAAWQRLCGLLCTLQLHKALHFGAIYHSCQ